MFFKTFEAEVVGSDGADKQSESADGARKHAAVCKTYRKPRSDNDADRMRRGEVERGNPERTALRGQKAQNGKRFGDDSVVLVRRGDDGERFDGHDRKQQQKRYGTERFGKAVQKRHIGEQDAEHNEDDQEERKGDVGEKSEDERGDVGFHNEKRKGFCESIVKYGRITNVFWKKPRFLKFSIIFFKKTTGRGLIG